MRSAHALSTTRSTVPADRAHPARCAARSAAAEFHTPDRSRRSTRPTDRVRVDRSVAPLDRRAAGECLRAAARDQSAPDRCESTPTLARSRSALRRRRKPLRRDVPIECSKPPLSPPRHPDRNAAPVRPPAHPTAADRVLPARGPRADDVVVARTQRDRRRASLESSGA